MHPLGLEPTPLFFTIEGNTTATLTKRWKKVDEMGEEMLLKIVDKIWMEM